MAADQDWRTGVDADLRDLNALLAKVVQKQVSTDEKIDSQNQILRDIKSDISSVKQGPELWRYASLLLGSISIAWFLVETYTTSAIKDALMADREFYIEHVDPRLDGMNDRLTINEELASMNHARYEFQWKFMGDRDERRERREVERMDSVENRSDERFERNEIVIERLRSARAEDNDKLRSAAIADKDELERAASEEIRDSVRRLETAVGHLRAAFSENLPGSD